MVFLCGVGIVLTAEQDAEMKHGLALGIEGHTGFSALMHQESS